ncbi:MAG: hypothetical protein ABW020_02330 [Candidatus Rokuibacteriota bacterium]
MACATIAGAVSACATDEASRPAVVDLAAVNVRLDEATATGEANTRTAADLDSRVRAVEAEIERGNREVARATADLERLRSELARAEPVERRAPSSTPSTPAPAASARAAATPSSSPTPAPPATPVVPSGS